MLDISDIPPWDRGDSVESKAAYDQERTSRLAFDSKRSWVAFMSNRTGSATTLVGRNES